MQSVFFLSPGDFACTLESHFHVAHNRMTPTLVLKGDNECFYWTKWIKVTKEDRRKTVRLYKRLLQLKRVVIVKCFDCNPSPSRRRLNLLLLSTPQGIHMQQGPPHQSSTTTTCGTFYGLTRIPLWSTERMSWKNSGNYNYCTSCRNNINSNLRIIPGWQYVMEFLKDFIRNSMEITHALCD